MILFKTKLRSWDWNLDFICLVYLFSIAKYFFFKSLDSLTDILFVYRFACSVAAANTFSKPILFMNVICKYFYSSELFWHSASFWEQLSLITSPCCLHMHWLHCFRFSNVITLVGQNSVCWPFFLIVPRIFKLLLHFDAKRGRKGKKCWLSTLWNQVKIVFSFKLFTNNTKKIGKVT